MEHAIKLVGALLLLTQGPSHGRGPALDHGLGYYDVNLRRVVLIGGQKPATVGDRDKVWTWSGLSWEPSEQDGPPARGNGAVAYDPRQGMAVVFGGVTRLGSALQTVGDPWIGGTEGWTEAPVSLDARDHHAMAYDEVRDVILLYGGIPGTRSTPWPTDTWAFRSRVWTRVASTGPVGRARTALAYDRARGHVVMFGGKGQDPGGQRGFLADTWVWKGESWEEIRVEGPPARYAHGMVYDDARRVVLVYGGFDANGPRTDLWQWDGAPLD